MDIETIVRFTLLGLGIGALYGVVAQGIVLVYRGSGILNFAPIVLHVPDEVIVNNVNLAIELENLSYFIQQ